MNEELLYKIWESKKLLNLPLKTTENSLIEIISLGKRNIFSGPDFEQGSIKINGLLWQGSIEIHVKASDWLLHQHDIDPAYSNVILHVVWQNDQLIYLQDGSPIPCLDLSKLIKNPAQYLPHTIDEFVCQKWITNVPQEHKIQMKHKCFHWRLQQKKKRVEEIWKATEKDWEETIYRLLAHALGFHQNAESMLRLATSIPLKLLWRYRESPSRIEALLFGQAGLLEDFPIKDKVLNISNEYLFLRHKHQLEPTFLQKSNWKFFKLRPTNYPTIRIFELAQLLKNNLSLLTLLLEIQELKNLKLLFESHQHNKQKPFGDQAFKSIVINAISPLLLLYGQEKSEEVYIKKAKDWIIALAPEGHSIEKSFLSLGIKSQNASDSQSLLFWKKNFCEKKKCSSCDIGKFIFTKPQFIDITTE